MSSEGDSELRRVLQRETLALEDVKFLFRHTRNRKDDSERIAYANSVLPEAGDYLRPYELRALNSRGKMARH
jgi:hypothetical protein